MLQQKFGGCRTSNAVYEPYDIIDTSKLEKKPSSFSLPAMPVHLHESFLCLQRSPMVSAPLASEPEVLEYACYRLTSDDERSNRNRT